MPKTVSVIMPTYNKKMSLELTLTSFYNQSYPADRFEVAVIDDGSQDGTDKLLSKLAPPFEMKVISQENKGRAAARNVGLKAAEGEIILFCDDDRVVEPSFIEEHVRFHDEPGCVVAGHRYNFTPFMPESFEYETSPELDPNDLPIQHLIDKDDILYHFDKVRSQAYEEGFINRAARKAVQIFGNDLSGFKVPWVFFVTSNVSAPKEALFEVGLFDEKFKGWGLEDWELGYRLYRMGLKFKINEKARNYHAEHIRNVRKILKEEVLNYRYFCEKHPYFEIYLLWRFQKRRLEIDEYNALVTEFYNLEPNSSLREDYLRLVKRESELYVEEYLKKL